MNYMEIKPIAYIRTELPEKFGVPRQSGIAASLRGRIVFEKEFRQQDAVRGLEGFSHIWLLWEFSANVKGGWQPTVRPPRLGGNAHMGVFATRSPFRPNPIGLSCVRLEYIEHDSEDGPVIIVRGADLMDGTPIYDIKPYIRYADSYPDAICGYVDSLPEKRLEVDFPVELASVIDDEDIMKSITEVLSLDPRPSYHDDPVREYGMTFGKYNIRFRVDGDILHVCHVL